MPCWDKDKGDIVINKIYLFKQLEIKGFTSTTPSSFDPTEMWDWIYFLDGIDIRIKNLKFMKSVSLTKVKYGKILEYLDKIFLMRYTETPR